MSVRQAVKIASSAVIARFAPDEQLQPTRETEPLFSGAVVRAAELRR